MCQIKPKITNFPNFTCLNANKKVPKYLNRAFLGQSTVRIFDPSQCVAYPPPPKKKKILQETLTSAGELGQFVASTWKKSRESPKSPKVS